MSGHLTEAEQAEIEKILNSLEVSWWLKDRHRQALILAYTLGKTNSTSS